MINDEYEKYKVKVSQAGTRHIDLYKLANLKEKRNLTKEEMEYRESKDELLFQPNVGRTVRPIPQKNTKDIYGVDKYIKRQAKSRLEAEFKKTMTERSNFTQGGNAKLVKQQIKTGQIRS